MFGEGGAGGLRRGVGVEGEDAEKAPCGKEHFFAECHGAFADAAVKLDFAFDLDGAHEGLFP